MKILVSGGAGRLGNILVRKLIEAGHSVRVLVHPAEPNPLSLRGLDADRYSASVLDKYEILKAMKGSETVFHLAAKISLHPDKDGSVWNTNFNGTKNMAECAMKLGVKKFIHCSSHHAVEKKPFHLPMDERRPLSLNDPTTYHRSKAHAEKLILDYVANGLPAIIVNPGTVIGPYDYGPSLLAAALIDFLNRKIPFMMNGISDYVDGRDIADGMIAAMEKGIEGERYFLTGEMLTMKELPILLEKITGKKLPKTVIPVTILKGLLPVITLGAKITGAKPFFTKDMLHASECPDMVSHEKAKKALGFKPRGIEEAFKATFEWYRYMGWISY